MRTRVLFVDIVAHLVSILSLICDMKKNLGELHMNSGWPYIACAKTGPPRASGGSTLKNEDKVRNCVRRSVNYSIEVNLNLYVNRICGAMIKTRAAKIIVAKFDNHGFIV